MKNMNRMPGKSSKKISVVMNKLEKIMIFMTKG